MSENDQKLNPQIAEVEVGIRNLRKINVYPLSMADQIKLTDTITKAIAEQLASASGSDIAVISFITNLIKGNIGTILTMTTDEDGEQLWEN